MTDNTVDQQKQTNLIVGCSAITILACLVFVIIWFANQTKTPAASIAIDTSYAEIRRKEDQLTKAQFEEFKSSIIGKRVTWSGTVADVAEDITGKTNVWISMDSGENLDVFFNCPRASCTDLNKGQPIKFSGDFKAITLGSIYLENGEILSK